MMKLSVANFTISLSITGISLSFASTPAISANYLITLIPCPVKSVFIVI